MQVLQSADHFGGRPGGEPHWVEHLSARDLSVGTYSVPAGSVDLQDPHSEDEIYVVLAGHGALATDTASVQVGPGSVVYVPAAEPHRFLEVVEDLIALVVFAPAEGTRAG